MVTERDIGWLAGIMDGEGCFSVKRPIKRGDGGRGMTCYQLWLVVCNTSRTIIERFSTILGALGIHHQPIRKVWKGDRATRWQYWLHIARKHDLLKATRVLLGDRACTGKRDEALIVAWYLKRACRQRAYRYVELDALMLDQLSIIKQNGGEAPVHVRKLMDEVIPSQASKGSAKKAKRKVSRKGVETTRVTPKNNPSHERPALLLGGGEIVRHPGKPGSRSKQPAN